MLAESEGSQPQAFSPEVRDVTEAPLALSTAVDSSSDTANTGNTARRQFMMNAAPVMII